MGLRKSLLCQHVLFAAQHQFSERDVTWMESLHQFGPVLFRARQRVLAESLPERRSDDVLVLFADAGQSISHEMHAAGLDRGTQRFGGCGLQAFVFIRDDQFGAAKATVVQSAQKLVPEYPSFASLGWMAIPSNRRLGH